MLKKDNDIVAAWEGLKGSFVNATSGKGLLFTLFMLVLTLCIMLVIVAFNVGFYFILPTVVIKWVVDTLAHIFGNGSEHLTYTQAFILIVIIKIIFNNAKK